MPIHSAHPTTRRLLRLALLVCVFGAVVFAFWHSNQRTMQQLRARQAIHDATGTLSKAQLDALKAFAASLERDYGLELRLQVVRGTLTPPDPEADRLYIGLAPAARAAQVQLPPLLVRSLDPALARRLTGGHFDTYWGGPGWPAGLMDALAAIAIELDMERPDRG